MLSPTSSACVRAGAKASMPPGIFALDVPELKLAHKVVNVGNCSGREVEKFERFGLTALPAERVAPPRVAECFANLECQVVDVRLVKPYDLFVLEVVKACVDPAQKHPKTFHHHGYGRFAVDGTTSSWRQDAVARKMSGVNGGLTRARPAAGGARRRGTTRPVSH